MINQKTLGLSSTLIVLGTLIVCGLCYLGYSLFEAEDISTLFLKFLLMCVMGGAMLLGCFSLLIMWFRNLVKAIKKKAMKPVLVSISIILLSALPVVFPLIYCFVI